MLDVIKQFFNNNMSPVTQEDTDRQLKLATAALFIEMMQQDGKKTAEEEQAVKLVLQARFALTKDETDTLIELAQEEASQAVDFYQFTSLIHQHFSMEEKIKILEYLWVIAYSDHQLDAYEEHMVRKIADLLYVPHQYFIKAKHNALEQLGL
jgi:uncharacterized tellurite resistance protein B-like protein